MKFGLISDIHGNYRGLRIALTHLSKLGCEVVCLGDIVSENSDDNEQCIQLLKKLNIQTVKGQHDDTCAKCDSPPVSLESRSFLQSLPDMMSYGDILCVHDNPLEKARNGQGMWRNGSYIWSQLEADAVFSDILEGSDKFRLVFFGHTHVPHVFMEKEQLPVAFGRPIYLSGHRRYLINPGGIGGMKRGGNADCTYLSFDRENNVIEFYRVEVEGLEVVKRCINAGEKWISYRAQKNSGFSPYQNKNECDNSKPKSAQINVVQSKNTMMFQITENLSVCGYAGISSPQEFVVYGFDAHLQCTEGFDDWIAGYAQIKCLPFKDATAIPMKILSTAFDWLRSHWEKGHKILISCAAGESRSVSIAIGLLVSVKQMSFLKACQLVFSAIPNAYPHPSTLLSVANYCNANLKIDQVKDIYDNLLNQPPFPWSVSEIEKAFSEFADMNQKLEGT